jgi:hypothetical protein
MSKFGSEDLAIQMTLPELIEARNKLIAIRKKFVEDVETTKKYIESLPIMHLDERDIFKFTNYEKDVITKIDNAFWDFAIVDKLSNAMTDSARHDLNSKLEKESLSFDTKNVMDMVNNFDNLYIGNLKKTVDDCYKSLFNCNASPNWRDKKVYNVNKVEYNFKCRLSSGYSSYGRSGTTMNDFLNVCYQLDGLAKPSYEDCYNNIYEKNKSTGKLTTPYFEAQLFLNGNIGIKFNQEKYYIIDRLNCVANEHDSSKLPNILKRKYKPEHFA